MITKFKNFQILENIKLSDEEKKYLWSKIEYTKKKKATETKNDLYTLLNTKKSVNINDFNTILKALEYTFRKKLSGIDQKAPNKEEFQSISKKIPSNWIAVKFSNLKAHRKEKIPTIKNSKKEIIEYLKKKNKTFDEKSTKATLIKLI